MQLEDIRIENDRQAGDGCEDFISENIGSLSLSKFEMLPKKEASAQQSTSEWKNCSVHDSEFYCFYAGTPNGGVVLDIYLPRAKNSCSVKGDVDVLSAAKCLGSLEELICLLEDWLNLPLDLELFTPTTCELNSVSVDLLLQELNLVSKAVDKVILHLPFSLVTRLSSPTYELANAMRWSPLRCRAMICDVELPSLQLISLQPGGVLLIPSAFESLWLVKLQSQSILEAVCVASVDAKRQQLSFERCELVSLQAKSTNGDLQVVKVELRDPLAIPVDFLAGWGEQTVFSLGKGLPEFEVYIKAADGTEVLGSLLAIGDGYGILIREVVANCHCP